MLRLLKEEQQRVESDKLKREEELERVKSELQRREQEVEKQRVQLEIEKEDKARQLQTLTVRASTVENNNTMMNQNASVSTTQVNDQTMNTLKEISDLKGEIMKLTTSLKRLKTSPEKEKSRIG